MKPFTTFNNFLNEEATTSWKKMMQGVKSSETGPWSLVAIENKKVVSQKIDIKTKEIIPAHYEAMKKEFPRAKIHIEDGTGMVVWNESLKLDESLINEEMSTAFLILMNAAIVNGLLIGQMASSGGDGGFTPIADLKRWWNKRKSDKALKSIIDKIKDDEDVVEFMKLTPAQQRGKFRSLIATKLTGDELEYLNKINRSHFKNESLVNETAADLIKYVETASQKTFKGGGNGQNLLDNAMELASHIGDYEMGRPTRGYEEDGFYGPATVTLFKRLVDQMSADDIKNNQADKYESVIATKLTGDELEYLNKINRSHFKNESVSSVNEEKYTIIDPNGNSMGAAEKTQVMLAAKKKGGVQSGYFVVSAKNALKAKRALEKFKGDFRNPKLKDIMFNLFDESVDEEVSTINDRYIPLFEEFTNLINEDRQITVKRKYTEKYPANTVGHFAKVRNNVLEAIADGTITQEQFDAIVSKISNNSKRWVRSNANCFVISEEGVSLSSLGKKILKGITVNEKTTKNPQVWVPGAFDKEVSTLKTSQITKEKVIELAKKHEVGVVDAIAYVEYGWNLDLK